METTLEFENKVSIRTPLHEKLFRNDIPTEEDRFLHAAPTFRSSPPSRHLRGSRTGTPRPPPVIYTSHGCLLIPVFVAAWWYYTKSVCRKMVRGFVRSTPEPDEPEKFHEKFNCFEDSYAQWEDSIHSFGVENDISASDRLVKWINRSNVHRRYQHHGLKVKTREYLYGGQPITEKACFVTDNDNNVGDNSSSSHNSGVSHQWECLPDVGSMELCSRVKNTTGGNEEVDNSLIADSNHDDDSIVLGGQRRMTPIDECRVEHDTDSRRTQQSDSAIMRSRNTGAPESKELPALVDAMT